MVGPRRSSRSGTGSPSFELVAVIAVVAAALGAMADAAPTGINSWDYLLKGLTAGAVVAAASRAPRWAVIVIAMTAAAASGFTAAGLFGWFALAASIASAVLRRRDRVVGAGIAALAVQSLLRLPALGFFGLPSIIAGAAFLLVLITGYQYSDRSVRRVARRLVAGLVLVVVGIALVGASALIGVRSDVDVGISAARRGLGAARSGDTTAIVQELTRAESALNSASSTMQSLRVQLLRLLPIASQHQQAIEAATAAGASASREAATSVREADIANISLSAGSVDIAALQAMAPRLSATSDALVQAQSQVHAADSPWLVSLVSDPIGELSQEIGDVLPELELAAVAAEVLPAMLGVDRPATYMMLFGTPAESRELGGFVGSWALVTFDQGRFSLDDAGRIGELYDIARSSSITPGTVSDWFLEMARPTKFPQNLTSSPDFAQVAEVSRQVLGSISDRPIEGFVYMDTHAFVDMLELTGPVQIPFQDEPLTVDNAGEFFFDGQYRLEDSSRDDIFDALSLVASSVAQRLTERSLPGPEELGRILGPSARGGHLQVVTFDERRNEFLRSVKLLRDFGRGDTADFVALVQTNAASNKLDLYLQRSMRYEVEAASNGEISGRVVATLRADIPPDAPDSAVGRGENRLFVSLYSPHVVTSALVNGELATYSANSEFGLTRYLVDVTLSPDGTPVVIEFELAGLLAADGSSYSLEVWEQPLVNTDEVSVTYSGPEGAFVWEGELHENVLLRADELAE